MNSLKDKLKALQVSVKPVMCKTKSGIEVYIKPFTLKARDAWEMSISQSTGKGVNKNNFRANLLLAVVCDEKGELAFSHISEIESLPAQELEPVFEFALEFLGITDKSSEEREKN
jgi:hypothetical protein